MERFAKISSIFKSLFSISLVLPVTSLLAITILFFVVKGLGFVLFISLFFSLFIF